MLLESPGEVVLREEIRDRLWPSDTVVEFDHGINAAVKRLRDALRDSAEKPRYIETLARRGYRFIGEVERPNRPTPAEPVAVVSEKELTNRPPEPASARSRSHFRHARILVAALLATIMLIVGVRVWNSRRGVQPSAATLQPLMRLDVDLGNVVSPSADLRGADTILSPDGTRLVYVSGSKLFTRRLDQADATELPGTEGAHDPFFSPDGQWVAFFSAGQLNKVSLQSGRVVGLREPARQRRQLG